MLPTPSRPRRLLALVAALLGAATTLVVAGPAHAVQYADVYPTAAVYTDSRIPGHTYDATSQPAWVGSRVDDAGLHTSRAYYTYDLSAYHGAHVNGVAVLQEATANDCSAGRRIEVWQVETPKHRIKWATPPRELALLSSRDPGVRCPWDNVQYSLDRAAQEAADGDGILTIEIRVPAADETNPTYGRSLSTVSLLLEYDHEPSAPTNLTIGGKPCGPDPIWVNPTVARLTADVTDPDISQDGTPDDISATFEIWPDGQPDQAVDVYDVGGGSSPAHVQASAPTGLIENGAYVMRVKGTDEDLEDGPWSAECRFNVDTTPPTTRPTVTSTDYPRAINTHTPVAGGQNVPGTFLISANGDPEAVGFRYGLSSGSRYVDADQPGGTAAVQATPSAPLPYTFVASVVDRAGNVGPSTSYPFNVGNDQPGVTDNTLSLPYGQPHDISFRDSLPNVVHYDYQLDGGPLLGVDADASGIAHAAITPTVQGPNRLTVTAVTATGVRTASVTVSVQSQSSPTIASPDYPASTFAGGVGVPGVFTFTSTVGAGTFTYTFDSEPAVTIPVGPDGTAQVTYTPTVSGGHAVTVTVTTPEGYISSEARYAFLVS